MVTGIDAGSKFLKVSSSNPELNICVEHFGRPEEAFEKLAKEGRIPSGVKVFTGHYGEFLSSRHFSPSCDEVAACVKGSGRSERTYDGWSTSAPGRSAASSSTAPAISCPTVRTLCAPRGQAPFSMNRCGAWGSPTNLSLMFRISKIPLI